MLVDFHAHTNASDGTLGALELHAAMRKRGVRFASITDHDSLAAYELLDGAASPRLVTGVEINTAVAGDEVHLLGYGFPLEGGGLRATLEANRQARRVRVDEILRRLWHAGYPLEREAVLREASGAESVGRPHVAKALVRCGAVRDVESAFRTLLSHGAPAFVPATHLAPHEAVAAIVRDGGLAVLAHPGRLRDDGIVESLIDAGLGGIEVFHPSHTRHQIAHFRETARRHGLALTAGSDFHDVRWNVGGLGVEVDADDIRPFLDLVV